MVRLKAVATSSSALRGLSPVSAQIIDVVRQERVCFRREIWCDLSEGLSADRRTPCSFEGDSHC